MLQSAKQFSDWPSLGLPLVRLLSHHLLLDCLILLSVVAAATTTHAQAPRVTIQPESQVVRRGATVTFSVSAEDSSPLSYQWMFNGTNLPTATNSALVLIDVAPTASGKYSVTVSSSGGNALSTEAVLTVCWQVQPASKERQNDITNETGVTKVKVDWEGNWYQIRYLDWNVPSRGFACEKFDSRGNKLWEASYRGTNGTLVLPSDFALDPTGSVYVSATGSSDFSGAMVDLIVMRFDSAGNRSWFSHFTSTGFEHPIVIDVAGSALVAGLNLDASVNGMPTPTKSLPLALTRLDPTGQGVWCAQTNSLSPRGIVPSSLTVDPDRSVYAAWLAPHAWSREEPYYNDFITAKLNSDGVELWRARYGQMNLWYPYSLLVDNAGNTFVTGSIFYGSPFNDHFTVKYSPDGKQLWVAWWPGQSEAGDQGSAALDDAGDLFITLPLPRWSLASAKALATAKFDPDGNRLWTIYESAAEGESLHPISLRIDPAESVFVTGLYYASSNDFGRTTIQYAQNTTPGLPVIREEPADRRLRAGETVAMSVLATGPGPLVYQWRYNGTNLAGATNARLVLSNIRTNQSGAYSVLVTNAAGCAISSDANLTVVEIPPFNLRQPVVTNQWLQVILSGGEMGRLYFIETSTNLVDWLEEVGQGVDGQGTSLFFFRRDHAQQFFRATTWP